MNIKIKRAPEKGTKHTFEHRTIERTNSSEFGRDLTQGVAVVRGRSLSHTHRHTLLYCFASTYCSNRHHIPISAIITTITTKVTKQTTASTGGAADRIRKEPQADLGTDVKPYWIDSILTRGQFSDSNVSWKRQGIAAETGPRLPAKYWCIQSRTRHSVCSGRRVLTISLQMLVSSAALCDDDSACQRWCVPRACSIELHVCFLCDREIK